MEGQNGFSSTCQKCGRTIYEGEMLNIKGRYVCEGCANSYVFGRDDTVRAKKKRMPSTFFHLICSFLPGAGHMYLGLMKTGLFQMCLFYFIIYLTTYMPGFFGLCIPVMWMYSFFDSLSLRRKIQNGEVVSDDLSGISGWAKRNIGILIIVFILLMLSGVVSTSVGVIRDHMSPAPPIVYHIEDGAERFEEGVEHAVGSSIIRVERHGFGSRRIAPILLVGVGGLIVYKALKKKPAVPASDKTGGNSGNTAV